MILKEPFILIRKAIRYCKHNKKYLLISVILMALIEFLLDMFFKYEAGIFTLALVFIIVILAVGYGLSITKDIINNGKHLPRFDIRQTIVLGVKGGIITVVFVSVQYFLTEVMSNMLKFEIFDLEEMLLDVGHTVHEFYTHNPIDGIIFIICGIILTYVFVFFMEISLAMAADDERLIDSFNLMLIKRKIDKIGWRAYTVEYSCVITAIVILNYISHALTDFFILDLFIEILMFSIEFGAIGLIYRKTKV